MTASNCRNAALGIGMTALSLMLLLQPFEWSGNVLTNEISEPPQVPPEEIVTPPKVPNIVHYIWFQNLPVHFTFDRALSILSAVKYIKPDAVYFHTNIPPIGDYFEMLKKISMFKVIHQELPTYILKRTYHETDYADFERVKILLDEGGIYLDLDVMVIKSFDPLRERDCTLGLEFPSLLCAGIIICTKNHPFLYMWLNSYYDDFRSQWAYNTGQVSSRLMSRYRGLIHVENTTLHKPNWSELDQIWGNTEYLWENNYAIHTWIRVALRERRLKSYPTPDSIKTMNTTYGQLARRVYYGQTKLINE